MAARLFRYKLPMIRAPFQREGLLLETDRGWGEIAPLPGFSKETLIEAENECKRLLPRIAQKKAVAPKLPSVRFGVACAIKPLPTQPIRMPLCALIDQENPIEQANEAHKNGFKTLKVKLSGMPVCDAINLIKELTSFRLRIDLNRFWTLEQAHEFARAFLPTDFLYLEEPLKNPDDLFHFSKETNFPLAIDESLRDKPIAHWRTLSSLKAIVVKPTILGTVPLGKDIILSGAYESGLGTIHIAHRSKSEEPIGLDTYRHLGDDLLLNPLFCEDGHLCWDGPFEVRKKKLCLIASAP